MEDRKNKPIIPPNYVTLQRLKERWLKEQQAKQDPGVAVVDQVEEEKEQHKQQKQGGGGGGGGGGGAGSRVKPIRHHLRRNHGSRVSSGGGAHTERTDHGVTVAAIVEGSGSQCTATETKREELMDKGKTKLKNKGKKKNEEKGELGREARASVIKSEKENVPARRLWKFRAEFRPKINSIVAESDSTVGIERKTEVVEDGGDPMTDFEPKFGDPEKTSERLESQIKDNDWSSGANGGYNGVPNSRNREKGRYNDGFNRGNRGGYGGFNRGTKGYRRYNAVNGKYRGGEGKQRVWVRKEEAADGGIGAI